MYLLPKEITGYEIEITSNCNARCPDCSRTRLLEKNQLIINEININDFKNWFSKEYVENKRFHFCGALGDAVVHKDCMLFIDHLKSLNAKSIEVVTNGSIKKPNWWAELALKANVVFSIDGLEDTNHIYRKNTSFKKIIENAKSFIDAGGEATWEYLIFDHNEHQIEEAKHLAKKLKFKEIIFKKTARRRKMKKDTRQYEDTDEYLKKINTYKINCKWKKDKRLFISCYNELFPCCHFNWPTYYSKILNKKYNDFNNLNYFTIEEILNHNFYKFDLEKSWLSDKKYECCALKCNVKTGTIDWRKNDRAVTF